MTSPKKKKEEGATVCGRHSKLSRPQLKVFAVMNGMKNTWESRLVMQPTSLFVLVRNAVCFIEQNPSNQGPDAQTMHTHTNCACVSSFSHKLVFVKKEHVHLTHLSYLYLELLKLVMMEVGRKKWIKKNGFLFLFHNRDTKYNSFSFMYTT